MTSVNVAGYPEARWPHPNVRGAKTMPITFQDFLRQKARGPTCRSGIETAASDLYPPPLTAVPTRNIPFRNLGWSGDTVWGEARARFGPASEGFAHLKQHVEALKPSVIFVNYGLNESFAGKAGLSEFERGLDSLLDVLDKTGARIVLITPRKLEKLSPPLPDPAQANQRLTDYVDVLRSEASKRDYRVVDLFNDFVPDPKNLLTDNSIHLIDRGYHEVAQFIDHSLGLDRVPLPIVSDQLRAAIIAKNELYFHRWRPENETYLFGFRKHEQGNNAREIPLFDPLVAAKEAEIAKLRISVTHADQTHRTREGQ